MGDGGRGLGLISECGQSTELVELYFRSLSRGFGVQNRHCCKHCVGWFACVISELPSRDTRTYTEKLRF